MIVYNKIPVHIQKPVTSRSILKESRRIRKGKEVTKNNREFLRALGFKV